MGADYPATSAADRSFTMSLKKYGWTWPLPWESWLRDQADLRLLASWPTSWGLSARYSMEYRFVSKWAANATFFSAGNGNYVEGAGTALSSTSLMTAIQTMRSGGLDPAGNPVPYAGPLTLVAAAWSSRRASSWRVRSSVVARRRLLRRTCCRVRRNSWLCRCCRSSTRYRAILPGISGRTRVGIVRRCGTGCCLEALSRKSSYARRMLGALWAGARMPSRALCGTMPSSSSCASPSGSICGTRTFT